MDPGDKFRDLSISGTNFGKAAADYGTFRAGFPESLFDRLSAFDVGLPGQRAFDASLASMLTSRFPAEDLAVPHRVFAIVATAPD